MRWLWFAVALVLVLLLRSAEPATNFIGPIQSPLPCTAFPALTGDVTTTAGSCATTDQWHKISTQTASAGASMAWTGLGSTYNNYVIWCYGVYTATASQAIYIQFGEGGTPTWETSNYQWAGFYSYSGTGNGFSQNASDSGLSTTAGSGPSTLTAGADFTFFVSDIPSTTRYTSASGLDLNGVTGTYMINTAGRYTGDTNAKTAIRVVAASGNITGSCTLWGISTP